MRAIEQAQLLQRKAAQDLAVLRLCAAISDETLASMPSRRPRS